MSFQEGLPDNLSEIINAALVVLGAIFGMIKTFKAGKKAGSKTTVEQ